MDEGEAGIKRMIFFLGRAVDAERTNERIISDVLTVSLSILFSP